jgi:hypothetical protein
MQVQAELRPPTSAARVARLTVIRTGVAGVVLCAVAALAVFLIADRSSQPSAPTRARPTSPPVPTVAPSTVLAQKPYIGVACPAPLPFNAASAIAIALACNRVGLSIDLRTRAAGATATIDGQSFKLDSAAWSDPPVGGRHKSLSGFLQPARFLHGPFKTVTFRNGVRQRFTIEHVHLVIDFGAGHKVQTSLQLLGYGGWG